MTNDLTSKQKQIKTVCIGKVVMRSKQIRFAESNAELNDVIYRKLNLTKRLKKYVTNGPISIVKAILYE